MRTSLTRRCRSGLPALLAALVLAGGVPGVRAQGEAGRAPAAPGGYINFTCDQVDIRQFINMVGESLDRKFVIAAGVEGKINVVAPRVNRSEVYPLFVSVLESVGCSVVEEQGVYRVVLLPPRAGVAAPVVGVNEKIPAHGVITKIMHIEHVAADEIQKVLQDKVGGAKGGAVSAVDETNHLVVTDTAENLRRVEKIVQEIDRPGLARVTEVVALRFAGAEDMAQQLNAAMAESETRADRLRSRLPAAPGTTRTGSGIGARAGSVVIAAPHSNSLLLVGTTAQLDQLKNIIKAMDIDPQTGRGRLNAIFLKYISAEEAAKSINGLLTRSAGGSTKPGAEPVRQAIAIEASTANNALLVDATPGDFDVVRKLVDQIDRAPEQVVIEVLIAEVSTTDSLEFGIEMAAIDMPERPGDSVGQGSLRLTEGAETLMDAVQKGVFPRGLTVGVAHGTRLDNDGNVVLGFPGIANIDALKKDGKVNIRSHTTLEAQNNREASVSVVNEIPILKSTVSTGTGDNRDFIQNIERMDVGIKLKLTPQIVPGGEVQMVLNPSIEAVIDPGPPGTQFAPTIAKREVSTTVMVPDGQTIVIAGLTREDKTKIVRKVPLLGSIPILGLLFRRTVDSTEKTDVLIFVTPFVVSDRAAAERIRKNLETRTGLDSSRPTP